MTFVGVQQSCHAGPDIASPEAMALTSILIPVDFSELSLDAARVALMIAQKQHAKLSLLHVDQVPAYGVRMAERVAADVWEAYLRERNQTLLHRLEEFVRPLQAKSVAVDYQLERGEPVESIVRFVETENPGLVVVTPTGAGQGHEYLMGSVAVHVAAQSPRPVLVARRGRDGFLPSDTGFKRMLVAIGDEAMLDAASDPIRAVAAPGAEIDLLYVAQSRMLEGPEPPRGYWEYVRDRHSAAKDWLAGASRAMQADGYKLGARIEEGSLSEVALGELSAAGSDLVVVGIPQQERSGAPAIAARRIARHAATSVLVVPFEPHSGSVR